MPLLTIQEPGQLSLDKNQEIAIGIDLGTTNSLVAISKKQQPKILADENNNFIQPSIVTIDNKGQLIAGIEAKNFIGEKIYSIKRLMGKGFSDKKLSHLNYNLKNADGQIKVTLGDKELSAVEISAQILIQLKKIAENNLKQPISKAVITVPAYFDEAARNATKQAAHLAGLEVLRLINEPTAAAIAYGLEKQSRGTFIVFDLGGGTFDVSALQLSQGVFKVLGVGGDATLGGDDFDHLIVDKIINDFELKNLSVANLQNIKLQAKAIKEQLTLSDKAEVNLENKKFKLSKTELENLSKNLVDQTIGITKNLLAELDLEDDQIEAIILVGGSTRMPIIKESLTQAFKQIKILDDIDPDKIVAMGAAIQAENLTTKNADNLLLDVIPLSLGIEMMGGIVEKIIERNTTIPTSASKEFTTYIDGQTGIKLHIVQGERELVQDCRSLANFEIKNIPPLKAGVARIKVTFTIDADGLLTVKAIEPTTNQVQTIEVKPTFGLDDTQIKNMLLESLKSSKADMTNRLLIESKVEAERSILAIKSALKEDADLFDKNDVELANNQVNQLELAIKTQNQKQINLKAENLERIAEKLAEKKMNQVMQATIVGKKIDDL